tara:strand:+ start:159 stop:284 length:126 start_codon:yes stop_codon:yes gene_type:complete
LEANDFKQDCAGEVLIERLVLIVKKNVLYLQQHALKYLKWN